MFIDPEFWDQFGLAGPPEFVWAFAAVAFPLVAPAAVVLGCVAWEGVRGWVRGE